MGNRVSTKNRATRTSPIVEQGGAETDWNEVTSVTLSTQPEEYVVIDSADGSYNTSTTDAVEAHTADAGTNGTVIYSSQYSGDSAFEAFDDVTASGTWQSNFEIPCYIGYNFNSGKAINKYRLMSEGTAHTSQPKDWTFEGSNDGTNWTVLSTETGQGGWTGSEFVSYSCNNSTAYTYYRLYITASNGSTLIGLREIELIEAQTQTSTTSLVTSTQITQGDEVTLINTENPNGIDVELGAVTSTTFDSNTVATEITLSNGNLTATASGTSITESNAYSDSTVNNGVFYCEFTMGNTNADVLSVGLSPNNTNQTNAFYDTTNGIALYNTNIVHNSVDVVTGLSGWAVNDIIGIKYTSSSGLVEFTKNGAAYGSYSITANTELYAACWLRTASSTVTANFGATAFSSQPNGTEEFGIFTSDISGASLTSAPTKAFKKDDTKLSVCLESTPARIVNELNSYKTIDATTAGDGSNLVSTDVLTTGERIVVDGVDALGGTATLNGSQYTLTLPNHGLSSTPTEAYTKGGVSLTKVSSTTTEFVGTNATSGLLTTGDTIQIDGATEVVTSNVVESSVITSTDPLEDGSLVSKFLLESDGTDLTTTYDLTAIGTPTYATGSIGNGAVLNGTTQFFKRYGVAQLDGTFSISMRFKTTTTTKSTVLALNAWYRQIEILADGSLNLYTHNGASATNQVIKTGVNDGNWHTLVIKSTGLSDHRIYVDGVLELTSTATVSDVGVLDTIDWSQSVYFGASNSDPNAQNNAYKFLDGMIDHIELYSSDISDGAIAVLEIQGYKYTCTIPAQGSAPTSAKVLDRSKQLTVSSKLFDGTKFNYTYGNYVKGGRAIATKLESSASGTTVIQPLTVNVNKD